jgi:hypothetical protein
MNLENCLRNELSPNLDWLRNQLIGHLKEVRDRSRKGEMASVLHEFFNLYRFDDNQLDDDGFWGPDMTMRTASGEVTGPRRAEIQANQFAAALLMPADLVREAFAKCQDLSELARSFNVSEAAMGNLDAMTPDLATSEGRTSLKEACEKTIRLAHQRGSSTTCTQHPQDVIEDAKIMLAALDEIDRLVSYLASPLAAEPTKWQVGTLDVVKRENTTLRHEVNSLRSQLGWGRKYVEWDNDKPKGGCPVSGG